MKKISMIVPCYNEEENIKLFYEDVLSTYKNSKDYKIELIFIDDGSRDGTLKELKSLLNKKDFSVNIISFSRNFGKESVIYAGLKKATGDYTLLIDADMQQRPSLTIEMAKILDENDDIDCVCYYQDKRKDGILSPIKKLFYKLMNKMSDVEIKQGASDFRMFRENIRNAIISLDERCRFTKGIFSWVGYNTKYIAYSPSKRAYGKSKWSSSKLLKYGIEGITSFSTVPLTFSTYIGIILSIISIIYLIVILVQKLFIGINIPGYPTIVALILLIGGINLFCIGIIGSYISKIYLESKQRPLYIIKEDLTNEKTN